MAKKKTCPACGAAVSPGEAFCTSCGAVLPRNEAAPAAQTAQAVQSAPAQESTRSARRVETPRTIEELSAFCERHELPLAKMRFFIGLDYPGAKAYGIFKDKNGDFVVYKNKADGSRAVRYRGPDEAHAVGEIFQKLKDEATGQRARVAAARTPGYAASSAHDSNPYNQPNGTRSVKRGKSTVPKAVLICLGVAAAITVARTAAALNHNTPRPANGYYHYNNNYYYNQNNDWYYYDDGLDGWYPLYSVDDELTGNYSDYYTSYSYDDGFGVESFSDSGYYDAGSSESSGDWDSDSSWSWDWDDDDSWDSSDDWDWDSDWDSDFGDWDSDW